MKNLLRDAFPDNSILNSKTIEEISANNKLYIIFIIPRSGSTWLSELANNTGVLGCPWEWFNDSWIYTEDLQLGCKPPLLRGTTDINEYVKSIVAEGPGVSGLELSVYQALMLSELLDRPLDVSKLHSTFYIRRKDIISQAISLHFGALSNIFHSFQIKQKTLSVDAVAYDVDAISRWILFLIDSEKRFDSMFDSCKLSPNRIFYEDLCQDPLLILRNMCSALSVNLPEYLPESTLVKLGGKKNHEWSEQYIKDMPENIREMVDQRSHNL